MGHPCQKKTWLWKQTKWEKHTMGLNTQKCVCVSKVRDSSNSCKLEAMNQLLKKPGETVHLWTIFQVDTASSTILLLIVSHDPWVTRSPLATERNRCETLIVFCNDNLINQIFVQSDTATLNSHTRLTTKITNSYHVRSSFNVLHVYMQTEQVIFLPRSVFLRYRY